MEKLGIGSKVEHPKYGLGVVVEINGNYYKIYFTSQNETKEIDRSYDGLEIKEKAAIDFEPIEISDIENHEAFAAKIVEILKQNHDSEAIKNSIQSRFSKEMILEKYFEVLEKI